jgi:hypothetical protein
MNHPKFNLWGASCAELSPTPTPDASPITGEGRSTGNEDVPVRSTRHTPISRINPPSHWEGAEGLPLRLPCLRQSRRGSSEQKGGMGEMDGTCRTLNSGRVMWVGG